MEEIVNEKFKQVDKTLENHDKRITETKNDCDRLNLDVKVSMAGINASLEKLSRLPDVLEKMDKTLDNTIQRQDILEKIVDEIKQDMKEVKDERNINFIKWISKNWFPVVLTLGALIAWMTGIIKI